MITPLHNVRGWLLDLDGTTYISDTLQPGAAALCQWFAEHHTPYFFFTNNPTRDPSAYAEHLTLLGITTTTEQIITSAQATIAALQRDQITSVYAVATPSFIDELKAADIAHTDQHPQAVVVSFDTTLTYEKLKTATRLLANPALPYIATNPDLVCPTSNGPIPDCGAIIAALKATTSRTPTVIGKPERGMVDLVSERTHIPLEQLAIIGDRLYTDIAMGSRLGITTVLVLNGETTEQMLADSPVQPTLAVNNLNEVLQQLKSTNK